MSVRQLLDGNGKIASNYLPTFIENELAAPVILKAEAPATAGNPVIYVEGDAASAYGGSFAMVPGGNDIADAPESGLTIRAQVGGVAVEVGANAETTNTLKIAGPSGLSQVYDGVYNQPVALTTITFPAPQPGVIPDPNPAFPPAVGNTGEIFRSTTWTGPLQQNIFTVPRTGWYILQTELAAGGVGTVLPIVVGVPADLNFYIGVYPGATQSPYASQVIPSTALYGQADVESAARQVFTNTVLLQANQNYRFSVISSNETWNLGPNGQIKAELVSLNR